MKQKYNGFTLIELMVSVALMLIIIGMTMVIFNSTSTTFTVAEAKVDIMQNARLALDTIAKDIANAIDIGVTWNNSNLILTIITVTNWREGSSPVTGKARVTYFLTTPMTFNGQTLYYLNRRIEKETNSNTYDDIEKDSEGNPIIPILAEYLVAPTGATINAPFYFEYFIHTGNSNTNWTGPLPNDSSANPNFYKPLPFNDELPPLVRITITVTDEHMNACRTLSRMIWIPKGIRRTAL